MNARKVRGEAASEEAEPARRVEQFAAAEREQIGEDDDREVAPESLSARLKLLTKGEPEEDAFGDGREDFGDQQVEAARDASSNLSSCSKLPQIFVKGSRVAKKTPAALRFCALAASPSSLPD